MGDFWSPPRTERMIEHARWGHAEMERYLAVEFQNLKVQREIVVGDAGTEIVNVARTGDYDLIALPTRGMGIFRRFLLGSTTAKVLHDADCPVWTSSETGGLVADYPSQVLCAIDLGPASESILQWASAFATACGANLMVVHVLPEPSERLAKYVDPHSAKELEERCREEIRDLLRDLSIAAKIAVLSGEAGRCISDLAATEGADQIVIGRGAVTKGLGRLRAHSYSFIRDAACPVISV